MHDHDLISHFFGTSPRSNPYSRVKIGTNHRSIPPLLQCTSALISSIFSFFSYCEWPRSFICCSLRLLWDEIGCHSRLFILPLNPRKDEEEGYFDLWIVLLLLTDKLSSTHCRPVLGLVPILFLVAILGCLGECCPLVFSWSHLVLWCQTLFDLCSLLLWIWFLLAV